MAEFFQINRTIVYFIYGGAFFVLGQAIALQSRKHSQLSWARHLWLLAAFGFIHGVYEWGSVFIPIQQTYLPGSVISALRIVRLILEVVSFLALFQFGVELMAIASHRSILRVLPTVMLLAWVIVVTLLFFGTVSSLEEFLDIGDSIARYLLAMPGSALAATGLWRQARLVEHLTQPRLANYFRGAALTLAVYAALSAIVPRGDFFPASVLNYATLIATVGIPAAIFRTLCGIIIAVLIIRGLEIFDVEADRLIEEAAQVHTMTTERERIGRELHDNIIQSIHAVGLMLEDANVTLDHDPAYAKDRIRDISQTLNRTVQDIRYFILDMRQDFDGGNWQTGLGEIARAFRLQTLIDTEFTIVGTPTWELSDKSGQEILALTREALTNVAKHAQATRVRITLTCHAPLIELEIADNGIGFVPVPDAYAPGEHQGLANMRERAMLIGASLTVNSAPQHGTTIHLVLSDQAKEDGNGSQDHAR